MPGQPRHLLKGTWPLKGPCLDGPAPCKALSGPAGSPLAPPPCQTLPGRPDEDVPLRTRMLSVSYHLRANMYFRHAPRQSLDQKSAAENAPQRLIRSDASSVPRRTRYLNDSRCSRCTLITRSRWEKTNEKALRRRPGETYISGRFKLATGFRRFHRCALGFRR